MICQNRPFSSLPKRCAGCVPAYKAPPACHWSLEIVKFLKVRLLPARALIVLLKIVLAVPTTIALFCCIISLTIWNSEMQWIFILSNTKSPLIVPKKTSSFSLTNHFLAGIKVCRAEKYYCFTEDNLKNTPQQNQRKKDLMAYFYIFRSCDQHTLK